MLNQCTVSNRGLIAKSTPARAARYSHLLLITALHSGMAGFSAQASEYFPISPLAQLVDSSAVASKPKAAPPSGWKTVRTITGKGDESFVSIMKTADIIKSDPDFVGLMVRCGPSRKIDVLLVIVSPLPPRSRPEITLAEGNSRFAFEGKLAAGGAAIMLPDEAAALAAGAWQAALRLSVVITNDGSEINGLVEMSGFAGAYGNLLNSCQG